MEAGHERQILPRQLVAKATTQRIFIRLGRMPRAAAKAASLRSQMLRCKLSMAGQSPPCSCRALVSDTTVAPLIVSGRGTWSGVLISSWYRGSS